MNKDILTKRLPEYLPEFFTVLKEQIESDDLRWGDTWKERGLVYNGESQESRFIYWVLDKYRDYNYAQKSFPWLKVAGEAFIGYIREKYLK